MDILIVIIYFRQFSFMFCHINKIVEFKKKLRLECIDLKIALFWILVTLLFNGWNYCSRITPAGKNIMADSIFHVIRHVKCVPIF